MSTVLVPFTADAANLVLDGARHLGPPSALIRTSRTQNPVAYVVAQEFMTNGTTSGTVTITAA